MVFAITVVAIVLAVVISVLAIVIVPVVIVLFAVVIIVTIVIVLLAVVIIVFAMLPMVLALMRVLPIAVVMTTTKVTVVNVTATIAVTIGGTVCPIAMPSLVSSTLVVIGVRMLVSQPQVWIELWLELIVVQLVWVDLV